MAELNEESTNNINSPRKLQDVSLPKSEHDITGASGATVSLKQYEEQLHSLEKKNFNLKLRVYFLEEKLGKGAPPAVHGLLELSVRLQVENEELRGQLKDTQELLAAAAEAIDVLEQQGSMSTDSVEASINASRTFKTDVNTTAPEVESENIEQTEDETCHETEVNGDTLGIADHNESSELSRLRIVYKKALQMIKGSFKKIQQQDKEIKKLRLIQKNAVSSQQNSEEMEKIEETLKCKDEYIKELERKNMDMQNKIDNDDNSAGNLHELLTRRMLGLAHFLDKMLSNKCVIGDDKKQLAESILQQSLALPVGLKLDESMTVEEFAIDDNFDISQSMRLEDLTIMLGHHITGEGKKSVKKHFRISPHRESDSEAWSEPDRNVSLARMGLQETMTIDSSNENRYKSRRSRISHGRSEDFKNLDDTQFLEEINQFTERIQELEGVVLEMSNELTSTKAQVDELVGEKANLTSLLELEKEKYNEIKESNSLLTQKVSILDGLVKEAEQRVIDCSITVEQLRKEKMELEDTFFETERSLRRSADEAALQASQFAMENARAQHDRMQNEQQIEKLRDKLNEALDLNLQLQVVIANKTVEVVERREIHSDDDRPTSPDQGIDSDRLSSLEHTDGVSGSQKALYEENVCLKQKLARTKATLADALTQLNAANMRKTNVQRAICMQIHKTHDVLRKARLQLENKHED